MQWWRKDAADHRTLNTSSNRDHKSDSDSRTKQPGHQGLSGLGQNLDLVRNRSQDLAQDLGPDPGRIHTHISEISAELRASAAIMVSRDAPHPLYNQVAPCVPQPCDPVSWDANWRSRRHRQCPIEPGAVQGQ
jgi:hypothetical protein